MRATPPSRFSVRSALDFAGATAGAPRRGRGSRSSDPREGANGGGTVIGYVAVVVETVVLTTMGWPVLLPLSKDARDTKEVMERRLDARFSAVMEVVQNVAIVMRVQVMWWVVVLVVGGGRKLNKGEACSVLYTPAVLGESETESGDFLVQLPLRSGLIASRVGLKIHVGWLNSGCLEIVTHNGGLFQTISEEIQP